MLTGYIRGQELRISTPEIAADSIKYLEAEFHFAGRGWDGYVKTAYFINGTSKFALVLADDCITADMGLNLTAGEWEVKLSGVKGGSRITTTTEHVYVREFGSTDGALPDVTATQAEQILAKIGDLSNLTTEDKTNLVAAINEAAKSGGGSGDGKDGTGIASITYKGKDEDGGNVYTVLLTDGTSYDITAPKGAKGDKGDKGDTGSPGADGVTPTIGDNGNWYIGSTDTGKPSRGVAGTPGAKGDKGDDYILTEADKTEIAGDIIEDGVEVTLGDDPTADNTLGITGATVGQIAKITAVDASGAPTAWEPVDMAGGGKEWKKVIDAEIAESTMVFEATGLDNVTDLYCEWSGLQTASETNKRDLDLYINDIAVGIDWVTNAGSNGNALYGYSMSIYNGFVWYNTKSAGIAGAFNAHNTAMGNNAKVSYRLVHGVGAATKIKIKAKNADNAPVVGKLEVWAR